MKFLPRTPASKIPVAILSSTSILLVLTLLLRVAHVWLFRIDSDEPLHLHSAWGWTQGLLTCRVFFQKTSDSVG